MTHVVWTSNFALFADRKLGFKAVDVGWVLAYIGLISILLRGIILPRLIDRYGERQLKQTSVAAIILGLFGLMIANNFWWLLPAISLFAFGNGLARPLIMGSISRSVGVDQQGAVIGVANSLGSLAQIVGPLIGGYLLTNFFPESVLLISSVFMGIGGVLVFKKQEDN
jgi:DHA1 family tetracycline resistance protein-like MFS transporter